MNVFIADPIPKKFIFVILYVKVGATMIDVLKLSDEIISQSDHIEKILRDLGHIYIRDRGKYYQTHNLDGDNNTAISILKCNLGYQNYTRNSHGNIFTLIQEEKSCDFKNSLKYAANCIGFRDTGWNTIAPFGGFYKQFISPNSNELIELPEIIDLPPANNYPLKWFKEGCGFDSMQKFGVRYDLDTDEILIPWYDSAGRCVGVKSRSNDPLCPMDRRWNMYRQFPISQVVYGLFENYNAIQRKKRLIIFEAEKSTLIADSFGLHACVSVGGHHISPVQKILIHKLMVDEIIVAFDQDLKEEEIRYESNKLKSSSELNKISISYIYDREGKYLQKGLKQAPVDCGVDVFKKLLKECKHRI